MSIRFTFFRILVILILIASAILFYKFMTDQMNLRPDNKRLREKLFLDSIGRACMYYRGTISSTEELRLYLLTKREFYDREVLGGGEGIFDRFIQQDGFLYLENYKDVKVWNKTYPWVFPVACTTTEDINGDIVVLYSSGKVERVKKDRFFEELGIDSELPQIPRSIGEGAGSPTESSNPEGDAHAASGAREAKTEQPYPAVPESGSEPKQSGQSSTTASAVRGRVTAVLEAAGGEARTGDEKAP